MKTDIDFAGIANAPSDYNSADGVMAHLVNLIPEGNELKAVGKGTVMFTVPDDYTLAYVHQVKSNGKHYIFIKKETDSAGNVTSTLYWRLASVEKEETVYNEIGTVNGTPKLVSIGNTLIAYSQDEMHYFLWKSYGVAATGVEVWRYVDMGNHLPELSVYFSMQQSTVDSSWSEDDLKEVWFGSTNILFKVKPSDENWAKSENQLYIEQQICAMANLAIQKASYYGNFIFPFFVRYAYRLFDGSTLTMHSAPLLMLPSTTDAIQIVSSGYIDSENYGLLPTATDEKGLQCWARWLAGKLRCQIKEPPELQYWKDVIRSVDIFVSAPIYTYRQEGKDGVLKNPYNILTSPVDSFGFLEVNSLLGIPDGFDEKYITTPLPNYWNMRSSDKPSWLGINVVGKYFLQCPMNSVEDIKKDAEQKALFYLLKSIPIDSIGNYSQSVEIPIDKGYLNSLVTKEVMTDDYNSHDILSPSVSYIYNSRLSLANIKRTLFKGFSPNLMTRKIETQYVGSKKIGQLDYYVQIYDESGSNVKSTSGTINDMGFFLYHPDSKAKSITVYDGENGLKKSFTLKNHDFLNGTYFLVPFWEGIKSVSEYYNWTEETTPPTLVDNPANDNNKIYTSGANMPFYFPVTGINTVGTGNILALTSITKALSEGQFGQFPLYAFTDEGIWALALSETGSISSVSPVTRDVCNNEKSITQIDDAVLFSSDRGLMMLTGSDSKCISEQLDGEWFDGTSLKGWPQLHILYPAFQNYNLKFGSFKEFIKDAVIAYDYPRQRVLVLNVNNDIAMAYSLRSQQWGQVKVGYAIAVANSYPGSVIQVRQFLSFNEREILDISTENSSDVLSVGITRPISFGDKNALKTVNDIIMRGDNVAVVLYGTRNNTDWHLVGSSKNRYLRGLCGSPYKAFRLLFIKLMQPGQIIKGASFEITPKDNNVLR